MQDAGMVSVLSKDILSKMLSLYFVNMTGTPSVSDKIDFGSTVSQCGPTVNFRNQPGRPVPYAVSLLCSGTAYNEFTTFYKYPGHKELQKYFSWSEGIRNWLGPLVSVSDDNSQVMFTDGNGRFQVVDWVNKRLMKKIDFGSEMVPSAQSVISATNGKVYVCTEHGDFNCACASTESNSYWEELGSSFRKIFVK